MTSHYIENREYKYYVDKNVNSASNNKRPRSFKDYAEQPLNCRQCNKAIIGEYNFNTRQVTTYEIDHYPRERIEHEHPADVVTRTSVIKAIAVEIRLLHAPDPDDFHYMVESG